jgi:hypothetical protein
VRTRLAGALLGCALLAAGCSDDPEPPPAAQAVEETPTPEYDAALPPAAAVMALVPTEATVLAVTDYEELRLQLGASDLTGASPARDSRRFDRRAERQAVLFNAGLLRADDQLLRQQYGFTQDDVTWQAVFATPSGPSGAGFVLALREGVDLGEVERAVTDGVASLAGAEVDPDRSLVTLGATADPGASWAADPDRVALVGQRAASTYVDTSCIPYADAFPGGDAGDLAAAPAEAVDGLGELTMFSVTYGTELVTVRLGELRDDVFDRARLPEILPRTDPEFARGYREPVADPSGGRIGYRLGDPDVAETLARERHLPFAVCAD